jgi:hypothetical protein
MKPSNREGLRRVLLTAVLKSDLTISEIQNLADEMSRSPDFSWEFGSLLRDVIDRVQKTGPRKEVGQKADPIPVLEVAYQAIQRRRPSKKEVLEMMEEASPGIEELVKGAELSMRQILDHFFSVATASEAAKFLSRFGVDPGVQGLREDAYLVGINRK